MATIYMNLRPCRVCSEVYVQSFLSEGKSPSTVLSPFKTQMVTPEQYSSQHQQILLL